MFTSSETALGSSAEFISPPRLSNRDDTIVGIYRADKAGTLHVEQSFDAAAGDAATASSATWTTTDITVTANDNKTFSVSVVAPFWRIRYTNGGTAQTDFHIFARTISAGDS